MTEYWTHWRHSAGVETRVFAVQWAAEADLGRAIYDGDEDDFLGAQIVQLDNDRLIASAVIDILPAGREWARLARLEEEYETTRPVSWSVSAARAA